MDTINAMRSFGALSQRSRLQAFRLLIKCGEEGMPAGEIARELGVPHNTMSTHLSTLVSAGLVKSRRVSRSIIYSADMDGTRQLLTFLVEDCCQGRPEDCEPLLESVMAGC